MVATATVERTSTACTAASSRTPRGGTRCCGSRRSATPSSSRTTTSCPRSRTSPHHTGDSLALSRIAAQSDASTIIFCGVHFMAETAKILAPQKTVLIPDERAGCSLADSITGAQLREWKAEHPGAVVVSYVNTTAEVKAETDICCTSSNAVDVVALDPGRPRGAVPARTSSSARTSSARPAARTCTSGRASATSTPASTAPSWPSAPPRTRTPTCSSTRSAAARPRRCTSRARASSRRRRSRSSRPAT